mmetsp:Transcript_42078/g.112601  ORF Transcript_42078/g.112601 Transcript_42078/m.112601 type:complete len:97 (+) Transcript_42078:223-513(+)
MSDVCNSNIEGMAGFEGHNQECLQRMCSALKGSWVRKATFICTSQGSQEGHGFDSYKAFELGYNGYIESGPSITRACCIGCRHGPQPSYSVFAITH